MISTSVILLLSAVAAVEPDFDTQVLPVLTRGGCNTGACHGAAAGRGGLALSLWGSNPEADYQAIVRELEGRRINLAHPQRSLLLRKPTQQIGHLGGKRFAESDPSAEILHAWIKAGAKRTHTRQLTRLEITPQAKTLSSLGSTVALHVVAHFSNGGKEDVTRWVVITPSDPGAVEVDASGKAKILRRGQHTVLVRYLHEIQAIRLTLPLNDTQVDLSKERRHNYIDDHILTTLESLHLTPSPLCDDTTFLRRVMLDLTGTLPTPAQVQAFRTDTRCDKRSRMIDHLLASSTFTDFWTHKWGDLLRIQSRSLGKTGAQALHHWVREQIARNAPLDAMARELITAVGDTQRTGPAGFARLSPGPREQAEFVSQLFMGARLRCANCHNHPLDRWTQDDYHGLAAVFARLERGPVVKIAAKGAVIHPRTGEPAIPRLPGERFLQPESDGREMLANWLTKKGNPHFARTAVNRLWKEMMGRGLVEPVDDIRATNPASHPALLDRLSDDFATHRYDLRAMLRLLANSATYQRAGSSEPQPALDPYYPHAISKPLGAEVLADALAAVTGVEERYGDLPAGTRAITLYDSQIPSATLEILGRCSRTAACEESTADGGLARTLHLINGPLLNRKITASEGRLNRLIQKGTPAMKVIEELYLRALGRPLGTAERVRWSKELSVTKEDQARREVLEDFLWALLSSPEFRTNH